LNAKGEKELKEAALPVIGPVEEVLTGEFEKPCTFDANNQTKKA
jgi:hypothetical protein